MTFRLCRRVLIVFSAAVLMLAGTAAAAQDRAPAGTGASDNSFILGDADSNQSVTILDATAIQRKLAGLPVNGGFSADAADVDRSGRIAITDATYIQRWLAGIEVPYPVGERMEAPTEPTTELLTEPATAPDTEPPTERPTDEEGWGRDIFRP